MISCLYVKAHNWRLRDMNDMLKLYSDFLLLLREKFRYINVTCDIDKWSQWNSEFSALISLTVDLEKNSNLNISEESSSSSNMKSMALSFNFYIFFSPKCSSVDLQESCHSLCRLHWVRATSDRLVSVQSGPRILRNRLMPAIVKLGVSQIGGSPNNPWVQMGVLGQFKWG